MNNLLLESNDRSVPTDPSPDQPNAGEIIQNSDEIKRGYFGKIQGSENSVIDPEPPTPPPAPAPPADPPPPPPQPEQS